MDPCSATCLEGYLESFPRPSSPGRTMARHCGAGGTPEEGLEVRRAEGSSVRTEVQHFTAAP